MNEKRDVPGGAREVPQEGRQHTELIHRIIVRAEKTFSGVERTEKIPVETFLQQIAAPGVAKAPCPRFKEWTSDSKGLEFTLATVVPPVPPSIVFGPFNFEREPVQMARCITADLLLDRYGVEVEPGGIYSPAPYWWLMVTASRPRRRVSGSSTFAIMLRESQDFYDRKPDSLFPLDRLVSRQGEIPLVVRANHHVFH